MKKILIIFFFLTLSLNANAREVTVKVIEALTLDPLELAIEKADPNTLVIFDVKAVLMTPRDQILSPAYKEQFRALKGKMEANLSEKEVERLHSIILSEQELELVEPRLLDILAEMKALNIKVIALTSGKTGKYGNIEKREDLRIQILKRLGVDFSGSYPHIKPIVFNNIKNTNFAHPPMFKEGILFTSRTLKGEVLQSFLTKEKIHPSKIIFFDNQMKNILSVGEFCKKAGIDYEGVHYTHIANRKVLPLDNMRAEYQFKTLLKEYKWLSDKDAAERLGNISKK